MNQIPAATLMPAPTSMKKYFRIETPTISGPVRKPEWEGVTPITT